MKLSDFKIGDILVITTRMRAGTETRCAQVSDLNYNGLGLVQHCPCRYKRLLDCGYGSWDPADVGAKQWGKQRVEIVGNKPVPGLAYFCGPRPGDTAYDLMC